MSRAEKKECLDAAAYAAGFCFAITEYPEIALNGFLSGAIFKDLRKVAGAIIFLYEKISGLDHGKAVDEVSDAVEVLFQKHGLSKSPEDEPEDDGANELEAELGRLMDELAGQDAE